MDVLLTTKLYIPRKRHNLVPRPRLIEQLNAGLDRKLTLICAPAGFGKTTLVCEWLDLLRNTATHVNGSRYHIAWLSLDESDNDLVRFLTYLIAAIQTTRTDIASGALSEIQSPQPPPAESILTTLINDVAAIEDEILFVLDDYHVIESEKVDEALVFLLEHLPPQLHLVITSRMNPFLPISRLRARGDLIELRAADLRFTYAEAAEFLNQIMGLKLSTTDISALENRTEGWIAGLQLAAISMQASKDTNAFIKSFTGSNRFILEYLIEEVLEQQPVHIQEFLQQTSVLNRLTGSLCDALTGQDNGQETLEMLERNNLFIVPLDNDRTWYRYHHLFADLLRQKLRQTCSALIPSLNVRASKWYEQYGSQPDSIRYAIEARDFERAADLAELAWPSLKVGIESLTWFSWVKDLPDDLIRKRPVLCTAVGWALFNAGDLEAADTRLRTAEKFLESLKRPGDQNTPASTTKNCADEHLIQQLPAWVASFRAYHAQAVGDVQGTAKYVEHALDLLPEDEVYTRASLKGLLGLAYWMLGDLKAATNSFSVDMFQNTHDMIRGIFVLADMEMTLGHLRQAKRTCEHGLQLAAEFIPPNPTGTEDVYTALSLVHLEMGDYEAASRDLSLSRQFGEKVELPDWESRWCKAQARLNEALGKFEGALALLNEAKCLHVRTPLPDIRPIPAMRVRIWIKQGRIRDALEWVRENDISLDDESSYPHEFTHLTMARIQINQYKNNKSADGIQTVLNLLKRLRVVAEANERLKSMIEILVTEVIAYDALGDRAASLASLEQALNLAEPEGFVLPFIEDGPSIMALLKKVQPKRPEIRDFILKLISVFESTKADLDPPLAQLLLDPLSDREIEVLELIAAGLTNQEIGSRLYLSRNTIKVHTRNIYSKLGVNSRTQAVAQARSVGILSL